MAFRPSHYSYNELALLYFHSEFKSEKYFNWIKLNKTNKCICGLLYIVIMLIKINKHKLTITAWWNFQKKNVCCNSCGMLKIINLCIKIITYFQEHI